MSNYQETNAPGTAWKRCHKVILENPLQGDKLALFLEQDVANIADKIIVGESTHCKSLFDPSKPIFLRDPNTGEKTGEYVTQAHLYQVLHSLYLDTAEERDNPTTPIRSITE